MQSAGKLEAQRESMSRQSLNQCLRLSAPGGNYEPLSLEIACLNAQNSAP